MLLCGSDGKELACNAGDLGSIPGLGRPPEGGHANPLQYSCLENSMDTGAWQATYSPWGGKELDMTEWLSTFPIREEKMEAFVYFSTSFFF